MGRRVPVEMLTFDFKHLKEPPSAPPKSGVCMHGFFLQHARMCDEDGTLKLHEPTPKQLFSPMVYMLFKPTTTDKVSTIQHFECPCYMIPMRHGKLSTTGQS